MSDIQTNEFDELKDRATKLGIKFHPAIALETLRERVRAALEDDDEVTEEVNEVPEQKKVSAKKQNLTVLRDNAMKLVRVRVTCMNPAKSGQSGVLVTVGNNLVGTVSKYVPFDTDWHIPQIMFNVMKEEKVQTFVTRRDRKGNDITESKLIPAYSIEILPDLTQAELKDLAQRQAMASGTEARD